MRRPPFRPLLLAVLLLSLPCAALAQGLPPADAGLRLDVPPPSGRGELAFNLTAGGVEARVNVVVTHEDPLAGTVVDRVVPLTLAANTTTEVLLKDVRVGTDFTVRVLDADVPLPSVSDLVALPDGSALPELPVLLEGVAPLPLLPGQKHTFRGYRVVEGDDRAGSPSRVFTFPSGLVAVAMSTGVDQPPAGAVLQVAVSRDGGHTFDPPVNVSGFIGNGVYGWSGAAAPDGKLALFYNEWNGSAFGATRFARFDPVAQRVTQRSVVEEGSTWHLGAAAGLPDGSALFLGAGLQRPSAPRWQPAIEAWRLAPDGNATLLGNLSVPSAPLLLRAASSPTGAVALTWIERQGAQSVAYRATSLDGRSFLPPVPMPELRVGDVQASPSTLALDAAGTLHVLAEGYHFDGWRNTTAGSFAVGNVTAYYGRFPLAGPATVVPVNGAYDPDALVPRSRQADTPVMTVHGSRVWIFWADLVHVAYENASAAPATAYGMESLDGGLTFGAPYEAETTAGRFPVSTLFDMTTFADGRPLLLSRYYHAQDERVLSVVPLFDPLPPEGAGLTVLASRPASLLPEAPPLEADFPQTREEEPRNETSPPADPPLPAQPEGQPDAPPSNRLPADPTPPADAPQEGPDVPAAALLGGLGALLAGAAALTEAGRYALGLLAAALYSRLSRSDVLRHEVRAGIHDHVRDHPGIRYTDLRRDMGLANGVLAHHLRVLTREGYVVCRADWTRRRYYATGAAPTTDGSSGAHALVLRLLEATPGLSAAEVGKGAGISRQLARYHLLALERAGLVEATRRGRETRYAPTSPRAAKPPATFHLVDRR